MAAHHRAGLTARLLLTLGATVASLSVAEGVVRAFHLAPALTPRPRYVENPPKTHALDLYPSPPADGADVDLRDPVVRGVWSARGLRGLDALAGVTPYGVAFTYNPLRCRDRDPPPPTPSVMRVVVIGDSFTEGQGVPEALTFPRRLESDLRARGAAVEVLNCGRRGRDFPALHTAFDAVLSYAPDVVLYAMVLNDPQQSADFQARQTYLNDWILDRRRMTDGPVGGDPWRWALGDLVRDRVASARVARATTQWYQDMVGPPNAAGWAATRAHLRTMDATMTARGGRLVVALLPLLVGTAGTYPFVSVHRTIAAACRTDGILFHDVLPALRGIPEQALQVHAVDMHPNARAHARIAADLAPVLAPLVVPGPRIPPTHDAR